MSSRNSGTRLKPCRRSAIAKAPQTGVIRRNPGGKTGTIAQDAAAVEAIVDNAIEGALILRFDFGRIQWIAF